MDNPLVSIVIPVYNVEKYVAQSIESIINQTYRNIEILIVDDGATDNSGNICDEYQKKDSRITVIHKENGGLSSARNVAMEIAKGEYIFFHDSDDAVAPDIIEAYVNLCKQYDAEIVMGTTYDFYGELIDYPTTTVKKVSCYEKIEALKMMFMDNELHHCAAGPLFKTALWKGIRFPEGKLYEDHATVFYVAARANRIAYCDDERCYYRMRLDSIMNSHVTERDMTLLDTNDQVARDIVEQFPELAPYVVRMTMVIYLKLYSRILYSGWNKFEEAQRRIKETINKHADEFINSGLASRNDKIKLMTFKMGKLPFYLVYKLSDYRQLKKKEI